MSVRQGSEGLGAWVLDRLGPTARTPRGRGEPTEVEVTTGPSVPAVTVRAVLALVGVVAVLVAGPLPGGAVPVQVLWLLLGVAVLPAFVPRWPATALVVLVVGVRVLLGGPLTPVVLAVLVLAVHVLLRLGAVAARTTWRTRVEVAVLVDDGRAALVAQGGAQVLAVVGSVAAGAGAGEVWRAVGFVAVTALAALALVRPVRPWWRGS